MTEGILVGRKFVEKKNYIFCILKQFVKLREGGTQLH